MTTNLKFEELDEQECWRLLAKVSVGKVAATVGDNIVVLPMTFTLEGSSLIFRVREGSVLSEATCTYAALEVDEIDEATHTGWSVYAQGLVLDITTAIDASAEHLRTLPISPFWAAGGGDRWMTIHVKSITGRRVA